MQTVISVRHFSVPCTRQRMLLSRWPMPQRTLPTSNQPSRIDSERIQTAWSGGSEENEVRGRSQPSPRELSSSPSLVSAGELGGLGSWLGAVFCRAPEPWPRPLFWPTPGLEAAANISPSCLCHLMAAAVFLGRSLWDLVSLTWEPWTHLPQRDLSSVQFSRSVVSDSLRPHESHYARPSCP